jgi:DNA-binding NarL/FixJ family response regulator
MKPVSIAIATQSPVIATGLTALLQRMRTVHIGEVRTVEPEHLEKELEQSPARVLIIDPVSVGPARVATLRESLPPRTVFVAICTCILPQGITRAYDYVVSLYDNPAALSDIISKIDDDEQSDVDDGKALSQREKEVVVGIVKGMSNKEIASEMNVSVNTVMTHRRNITTKLQIHSAAGLTIYAIVSKLVRLDEISTNLPKQ